MTAHLIPFHRSASVTSPKIAALLVAFPTAVHAVAEMQEIPVRALAWAPVGLGVGWVAQAVPFQASASVTPAAAPLYPAAVQAVADVQDTPASHMSWPWSGPEVGWTAHVVPFQASARVASG
jgi:hypothetical protein